MAIIRGRECGRTVSRLAAVRAAWGLPPASGIDVIGSSRLLTRRDLLLGSFWSGLKMTALDPVSGKPKDVKALTNLAQRAVGKPGAVEAAFLIRRGGGITCSPPTTIVLFQKCDHVALTRFGFEVGKRCN
ncbi:MAG TPA: hypothetical protein VMN79_07935 [Casimicrobiaceae bacterium]|nr:hypothetical protein [Casimicrobiaceae bacterium]